jgi:chromosome segregation ATPase
MNYKFSRINTKGKEYNNLIKNASKIIETLTPYADDIEKLINDFNEKSNLNNKLINVKNNISIKQNAIDKYNKILSDKTDTLIEEITTYLEKFKSVCILTDNININSEKRASKSRDIRSQTDQIKRCQNELDDIWTAVKEMGLVCDSCNSFGGVTL